MGNPGRLSAIFPKAKAMQNGTSSCELSDLVTEQGICESVHNPTPLFVPCSSENEEETSPVLDGDRYREREQHVSGGLAPSVHVTPHSLRHHDQIALLCLEYWS